MGVTGKIAECSGVAEGRLVEPSKEFASSYRSLIAEIIERKEILIPFCLQYDANDFEAYLQRLRDDAAGIGLPEGYVPASTFWLLDEEEELVAVAHLRHRLTPALLIYGGHVGYGVRPSRRNQGYATLLLKLVLPEARALGIEKVLVTCDKKNLASARVIVKNGGVLDSEVPRPDTEGTTQRYWITLGHDAG